MVSTEDGSFLDVQSVPLLRHTPDKTKKFKKFLRIAPHWLQTTPRGNTYYDLSRFYDQLADLAPGLHYKIGAIAGTDEQIWHHDLIMDYFHAFGDPDFASDRLLYLL